MVDGGEYCAPGCPCAAPLEQLTTSPGPRPRRRPDEIDAVPYQYDTRDLHDIRTEGLGAVRCGAVR